MTGVACSRRTERRVLALFSLLGVMSGCAGPPLEPPASGLASAVGGLSQAFLALGPEVDSDEARRAAGLIVRRASELEAEYGRVASPRLHNLLVNAGLRRRGLCCHFAEDLIEAFRSSNFRTLEVHWAVARHGDPLREHSGVIVAPAGGEWREGVVIDAWRRGGQVFWTGATEDRYPWRRHPLSGEWDELHCLGARAQTSRGVPPRARQSLRSMNAVPSPRVQRTTRASRSDGVNVRDRLQSARLGASAPAPLLTVREVKAQPQAARTTRRRTMRMPVRSAARPGS